MKKIGLIIGVILIGSLIFGVSKIIQNPEQYQKKSENVTVVFNCSKFSRISADELKAELGEPTSIEDWDNKTSKGNFQMQTFSYDFEGFYGDFILYENKVVKLHLFSDSQWEEKNFNNIFSMFGIKPNENIKKVADTGFTHKFSPVSDKVAEVEIYNFDKNNNTFNTVYVTYNLNYFN